MTNTSNVNLVISFIGSAVSLGDMFNKLSVKKVPFLRHKKADIA